MDIKIIIGVFFYLALITSVNAQGKYSVDSKKSQERKVPLSYIIAETKTQLKTNRDWRKNKRFEDRSSRKTKKHIYKGQNKKVKKRMKLSEKKAENYNRGKLPLRVKLKRLISNG